MATAAIFSFTGCSDRPPREDAQAELMNAETAKPEMSAQDSFFDGKLLVEANLGRGFSGRGGPGGGGHGGGRRGGGGHHGGGGMGGPGGGSEGEMGGPGGEGGASIAMQESTMPPVALHLRLTNKSKETLDVTFVLCKSELGDFAVRPEKLALAPDQTAEPDAMTSRLGLTSDELVLRVSLKTGGVVEAKDLVLKAVAVGKTPPSPKI